MRAIWRLRLAALLLAVLVAAVWGSVFQTQSNLAQLQALGAQVPWPLRLQTTLQDLAGFGPLFAAVAVVAFVLAFPLAAALAKRIPSARSAVFAMAGMAALVVAIRLIDALVPPPVLIAATRSTTGLLWMTLGGAIAGGLFAVATRGTRRA